MTLHLKMPAKANNLSPNMTSSDSTPSLTNKHAASFTCGFAPLINL